MTGMNHEYNKGKKKKTNNHDRMGRMSLHCVINRTLGVISSD